MRLAQSLSSTSRISSLRQLPVEVHVTEVQRRVLRHSNFFVVEDRPASALLDVANVVTTSRVLANVADESYQLVLPRLASNCKFGNMTEDRRKYTMNTSKMRLTNEMNAAYRESFRRQQGRWEQQQLPPDR